MYWGSSVKETGEVIRASALILEGGVVLYC